MVSIKSLTAALAFQVLSATAVQIHFCEHTNWSGVCRNDQVPFDNCKNVPSGWNDRISSIRNDERAQTICTWYIHENCQGDRYENQNDANLSDGNGKFNDSISSYSCRWRSSGLTAAAEERLEEEAEE